MHPKIPYDQAAQWAGEIVEQMTLTEKCAYIGGSDVFLTKGIDRLNIPPVLLSDATAGVVLRDRFFDTTYQNPLSRSTAFPAPIILAATWNPDLAKAYATSIAEQCRANGIGVLLGPGFNLYRISQCGRNFEYFGEDPHLISRMIEQYVDGVQSTGVVATLKHFVANNTDYFRRKSNSIVDERTLNEIYLPGFKAGINAGALAVMTSYNLLNGEWTGESEHVINNLLRKHLGFKWLVMTDWWSVYDGAKVAKSGQDLEMPASEATADMEEKITTGEVSEADLDRMVKSILTTFKAMELFDLKPQPELQERFEQHEQIALQTAREGIVLLRNQNNTLPLADDHDDILLLGPYIQHKASGGGSSFVKGYNQVTQYEAFKNAFPGRVRYDAAPTDETIRTADRIILSIGTQDAESWDRPFALGIGEERYIKRIVNLNPNVIVLVNAGSGIRMTDWYEKTAAIVFCGYSGQNGDTALAEILTGQVNPSGKLPFTIEREFDHGPGAGYIPEGEVLYNGENDEWEKLHKIYDVHYKEGVFVGYRWYEHKNIAPLYPFGHGLSYTHFDYTDLELSASAMTEDESLKVSFTLHNTGARTGHEIAQVYVSDHKASVPRPVKELKGFRKLLVQAGSSQRVTVTLNKPDFSFWCDQAKAWVVEPGDFEISVGRSSSDIVLRQSMTIKV